MKNERSWNKIRLSPFLFALNDFFRGVLNGRFLVFRNDLFLFGLLMERNGITFRVSIVTIIRLEYESHGFVQEKGV